MDFPDFSIDTINLYCLAAKEFISTILFQEITRKIYLLLFVIQINNSIFAVP